jgi:DNA-directed RNA polymerase subunit H (RpoH/RPB5)
MERRVPDGSRIPLTVPNHRTLKRSTLRTVLTQVGLSREEFLDAYRKT